jgi:DNA-binding transcriptional LysR family regulator
MFNSLFDDTGLSLDRLRALLEVRDAGSIAEAAPGDPIRQSQYSRQLRELSDFFGVKLGRRQGKLLKLTDEGLRLAELAREHLRSLQDFRSECRADGSDYAVAAGDSLLQWLVLPRLGALIHGKRPLRFATANLRTHDIVRQLIDGRTDVGVLHRNAVGSGLKMASLGILDYCAVVPASLIKGKQRPLLREILADFPIAVQTTDGQFGRQLREITVDLGLVFRPALACQSFPQSARAVKSGLFAAILPKLALTDFSDKGHVVIEGGVLDRLQREIVLAWNSRIARVRPGSARLLEQMQKLLRLES